MKVEVQSREALVGQYIRQTENYRIYRIKAVENRWLVVDEVEGMCLPKLKGAVEELITWAAFQRFYVVLVNANEIKGLQ